MRSLFTADRSESIASVLKIHRCFPCGYFPGTLSDWTADNILRTPEVLHHFFLYTFPFQKIYDKTPFQYV